MNQDDRESILAEISEVAMDIVAQTLQQRGLKTDRHGGQLHISATNAAIQCAADNFQSYPQGWMVQVNFVVTADCGSVVAICDTNVGIGKSLEAAILESVGAWVDGVFAPIQAALDDTDDNSEVNIYDLTITDSKGQERLWVAYAGPFQIRGVAERQDELARCLNDSPPLITVMLDRITDLLGRERETLIWIKFFLQQKPGGQLVAECKANNQDWLEGQKALANFSWPPASEGMLFKQFVVLKRC